MAAHRHPLLSCLVALGYHPLVLLLSLISLLVEWVSYQVIDLVVAAAPARCQHLLLLVHLPQIAVNSVVVVVVVVV